MHTRCVHQDAACGPIIAVTVDMLYAETSGTTVTATPTLHERSRPTAATATTTPAADRPEAAALGPSGSGRRPRRRNALPSPTSTTRVAAATDGDDDTAEFPVTFRSADLFAVTKTKLYSTFSISMKVCQVVHFTSPPTFSADAYRNASCLSNSSASSCFARILISLYVVLCFKLIMHFLFCTLYFQRTRGQSNLTKSASRGAYSPVRGHPRGSKFVPLNSWGRGSY